MPVPSLAQLIHRKLIKNITMVTDVGVMPYDIVRPILLKLENPQQLKTLEDNSPQLCGADEEIWIGFIKRDIPDWESKILYPRKPESWWKVYRKLIRDHENEVQIDAAALKAQFSRLKKEKDKNIPVKLEEIRKIPKMDGMQYAHAAEYNRVKKRPKDTRPTSTVLSFNGGSNTRVLTGKGVMKKSEREAREMNHFTSNTHLSIPTHQLKNAASKVLAIPPGLIDNFRRAAVPKPMDPTVPKPAMFVPPTRRIERNPVRQVVPPGMMTTEERERRLRALTTPGRVATAPTTSEPQTSLTTPQSSTDNNPTSSASSASSSAAKLTTTTDKKLPLAQPTQHSAPQKRKTEASSTVPSSEFPKRSSVSSAGSPVSSTTKSSMTTDKNLPSASAVPSSTQLKRKAEEPAMLPSIESNKRSRISNASNPSSYSAKSTATTDKKLPSASSIPTPTDLKRKAEGSSIIPSIESTNSQPSRNESSGSSERRSSTPHRIPRVEDPGRVSNEAVRGLPKRKTPVNCFIPAKKKRLS